jgi:hypothetical protein
MFSWPTLELTDYESKFVRIYKTKEYPGVLNRRYKITLNSQANPEANLPQIQLAGQIQIARRSRVYALTFVGNTDRWRLNISNASGTQFTQKSPRGQLDPVVSCLVPGNIHNGLSLGGQVPPITVGTAGFGIGPAIQSIGFGFAGNEPYPLLLDPNWLLMPNETLIFTGTPIDVTLLDTTQQPPVIVTPPLVLDITIHVWEFPLMGTAPAPTRGVK